MKDEIYTEKLKIYLRNFSFKETEELKEIVSSAEMNIPEVFPLQEFEVRGQATVAGNFLILHISTQLNAQLECCICTQTSSFPISLNNYCISTELEKCDSTIFYFGKELQDALLLEIPIAFECNQGNCPERKLIQKYLKSNP